MRLIVDLNSMLNAALLRGVDDENGRKVPHEGRQVQVNSAEYGVDNFFVAFKELLEEFDAAPIQVLGVWDGPNAKMFRRVRAFDTYKAGRDKAPEISAELNKAREAVNSRLKALGTTTMLVNGMEADDVIAFLTKTLRHEPNTVVTADGDLTVLVDENTHVWRLGKLDENPYGPFPHKYITLYKALVGDTGDKIPGAKGFGDVAWVDLVRIFGLSGLDAMIELIEAQQLQRLSEDVAEFPKLKAIMDSATLVYQSWAAARLYPQEVNTLNRPLLIEPGMVTQWDDIPDSDRVHDLKGFYGTKTLVHAGNYAEVYARLSKTLIESPEVALDIETSSVEESDEWMESIRKRTDSKDQVDPLGHELTGMGLTFGRNLQHSIYMTVDHLEVDSVKNITVDQCRKVCELIPQTTPIIVQNRSFEFSVLYRTWGVEWKDNGWSGFLPNCLDTKIGASYVNENLPKGLKQRSKLHLGYEQTDYETVTSKEGPAESLPAGGVIKGTPFRRVVREAVTQDTEMATGCDGNGDPVYVTKTVVVEPEVSEEWVRKQYKMNELPAGHVLNYGCDDTICTAALHQYYKLVMQLEGSWDVYKQVETLPEYLTSLAYVQGVRISKSRLRELEAEDAATRDKNWAILRDFLIEVGWEGTRCPSFVVADVIAAKVAISILTGEEYTTRKRKANAVAAEIREQFPNNDSALLVADCVETGNVEVLNRLVADNFDGEPKLNLDSPRQVQRLLYQAIGITPRIYNKLTDKERQDDEMRKAFYKIRDYLKNPDSVEVTDRDRELWAKKASTDDDAVTTALGMDTHLSARQREVLQAYADMKTVLTRFKMFYGPYNVMQYWKDGLIHSSMNQAEAVTRRYSSSRPNLQQMPKRGDGVKFRTVLLPHHKDAVVVSLDFNGQELRLMAEQSGDEAMISCYVGDNLRDIHCLTAVASAVHMWGRTVEYSEFVSMLEDPEHKSAAKLLRSQAKTVNFASQYDAMAPKIAQTLMVSEEIAQAFLDAKSAAFPGIDTWKEEVRAFAEEHGYVTTMLGARRHLAHALKSENRWEAAKAGRQGPNFKIQGSGAEMTKLAMARMWSRGLFSGRYDARFIAPIHDEVVFSVHRDQAAALIAEVHECMTAPYSTMKIPVVSSISLGLNFGDQVELGEEPDAEAIEAALSKLFGTVAEAA